MIKKNITLIKNTFVSVSSAAIDIFLFWLFELILGKGNVFATYISRVLSGIYNFSLSKVWTFEKKKSHNTRSETIKYLIVFFIQMQVSAWSTSLLENIMPDINSIIIKIFVDVIIFFVNFLLLKYWVFKDKKSNC